jgi:flagellar basal-body rod modification protein FlgD
MFNSIKNFDSAGASDDVRNEKLAEMKKTQQMFFKLLTTQLKCQDIDSPVDMNQMTQNIYQMNELQTLMSIDYKLDGITRDFQKNGSLTNASSMIGKFALTKSDSISVDSSSSEIPVSYIVDGMGRKASVRLLDDNGQVVHEAKLENIHGNAMENFVFNVKGADGKLTIPEGTYKIQLLATDSENKPVRAEMFTTNRIQQALMDGTFIMGNGQKIKISDIFAIQETPLAVQLDYNPFVQGKIKQSVTELMNLRNKTAKI